MPFPTPPGAPSRFSPQTQVGPGDIQRRLAQIRGQTSVLPTSAPQTGVTQGASMAGAEIPTQISTMAGAEVPTAIGEAGVAGAETGMSDIVAAIVKAAGGMGSKAIGLGGTALKFLGGPTGSALMTALPAHDLGDGSLPPWQSTVPGGPGNAAPLLNDVGQGIASALSAMPGNRRPIASSDPDPAGEPDADDSAGGATYPNPIPGASQSMDSSPRPASAVADRSQALARALAALKAKNGSALPR